MVGLVQIQVLRISYRKEHGSQVGGDGLQHDEVPQSFLVVFRIGEQGEGNEGDQADVVGHQHGAEEDEQYQQHGVFAAAHVVAFQLFPDPVEKPGIDEALYGDHQAEEHGDGLPVDIGKITPVRRDRHHAEKGEDQAYGKHRLLPEKPKESTHERIIMRFPPVCQQVFA